jgi:hypothetical protein
MIRLILATVMMLPMQAAHLRHLGAASAAVPPAHHDTPPRAQEPSRMLPAFSTIEALWRAQRALDAYRYETCAELAEPTNRVEWRRCLRGR